MKMISELFIKQKTWLNFVSFLTEQSLCIYFELIENSELRGKLISIGPYIVSGKNSFIPKFCKFSYRS